MRLSKETVLLLALELNDQQANGAIYFQQRHRLDVEFHWTLNRLTGRYGIAVEGYVLPPHD